MESKEYQQKLVDMALEKGAVHAVPISIDDIVFDPRTILKCSFGCKDWGKMHTCPSRPGALSPEEFKELLSRYRWGVITHSHTRKEAQKVSLALEGQAFIDGYYMVFSLADCSLCDPCAGHNNEPCRFPLKARPALQGAGVNVFATVRKLGLPVDTLPSAESEPQNWYAAVLVE